LYGVDAPGGLVFNDPVAIRRSELHQRGTGRRFLCGLFLAFFIVGTAFASGDICVACQKEIRFNIYTWLDKVTRPRVLLCGDCIELPDNCYLCSVPVLKHFTELSDGRVICKRDVSAVVLDDKLALQICEQVKEDLGRQFIRFIAFPETNVTVQLMDRVTLQEMYKVIGNDYSCPNTIGCVEAKTNAGQRFFEISILSGQPRENVMTTCVHEYAHIWIIENVPPARAKKLGKDAVEGFCELLSFLFAEQQGLTTGKSNILANHYTRGQIHLFIDAHHRYGFADVVDWMIAGDDPLLLGEDLSRLRRLEVPAKPKSTNAPLPMVSVVSTPNLPPELPEKLVLQGIIWSKNQPMATINGQNFDLNQEVVLQLSNGLITVRCLEIHPASVVLQTNNAPEHLVLAMIKK
jgi:hypothetical protein